MKNQDDKDESAKIFSVPDFVGDACKAIASRIRGAVAAVQFDDFHKVTRGKEVDTRGIGVAMVINGRLIGLKCVDFENVTIDVCSLDFIILKTKRMS